MGTPYNGDELKFTNQTKYTLRFIGPYSSTNPDNYVSFSLAESLLTIPPGQSNNINWVTYTNKGVLESYLEIQPYSSGYGINTKQRILQETCKDQDLLFTNILTKNDYTDCGYIPSINNDYVIQFVDVNSDGSVTQVTPGGLVWIRETPDEYLTSEDVQFVYFGNQTPQLLFQITSYYQDSTFYFTVSECTGFQMPLPSENGTCKGDPCSGEEVCQEIAYPDNLGSCPSPNCKKE